ncbi:MAG: type 1 glutamine amidotransferase [Prevotellaceae bacterium]|jgi:gamma-glutamyl-gamma-aminobutyrate hydrolase PuuD|nr:type 1 glutamine amidotransferase [Prevotellaceae bacterium]
MKKVLIVSRRLERKNKPVNWVSEIYLQLLAERGLMPVIVPVAEATKLILTNYLADYAGLLLTEGGDVNPARYGENYQLAALEELDPIKDEIELACCRHALEHDKAILGICRGMHIINVAHGGTLLNDVHEHNHHQLLHIDYENYDTLRHPLRVEENTPLYAWYGEHEIRVNSYHHQGIKKLGNKLVPMAFSADGLIEAIYNPDKRFVVGLQFHPERMLPEYAGNYKVFDSFANAIK